MSFAIFTDNASKKIEFIKFLCVGGINTLFGYGLYAGFVFLGLAPELALLLSTILGALFNFFSFGRLVFKSNDNRLLIRFITLYAMLYLINSALLHTLVGLGVGSYVAQITLLPFMAISTYFAQKRFVFKGMRK